LIFKKLLINPTDQQIPNRGLIFFQSCGKFFKRLAREWVENYATNISGTPWDGKGQCSVESLFLCIKTKALGDFMFGLEVLLIEWSRAHTWVILPLLEH
jgi:hypothetical protein